MEKSIFYFLFTFTFFLIIFAGLSIATSPSTPTCEDHPARLCSSIEPIEEGLWIKYTGYTLESEGVTGFPGVCGVDEVCWLNVEFNHKKNRLLTETLPLIFFGVFIIGLVFGLNFWIKRQKQKNEKVYRVLGELYDYLIAFASPILFSLWYLFNTVFTAIDSFLFPLFILLVALVSPIILLVKKSSWAARIFSIVMLLITLFVVAALLFRAG